MNPSRMFLMYLSRIPPAVMLVLIIALGLTAATVITSNVNHTKNELEAEKQALEKEANRKVQVVCAARDINEGQTISPELVSTREIPAHRVPSGTLTNPSNAVGRIAKFSLAGGQLLTTRDLIMIGQPTGFQAKLPQGYRAVTFPVDNTTGVAGFIGPDSRVDIMATIGGGMQTKTYTILSDVMVVAVGQEYQPSTGKTVAHQTSSVTVAVEPAEARKLISAMSAGKLHCALRKDDDHTPVAVTSLPFKHGQSSRALKLAPPPPPPPIITMELPAKKVPNVDSRRRSFFDVDVWLGREKDVVSLEEQ